MLEQKEAPYRGIGFVIDHKIIPFITKYISDRVAILDLEIVHSRIKSIFRIVNAYGPTSGKAKKYPNLLDKFYSDLEKAIGVPSKIETRILGDFNSRVRVINKESREDVNLGMGNYGYGKQNEHGLRLLHFLHSKRALYIEYGF